MKNTICKIFAILTIISASLAANCALAANLSVSSSKPAQISALSENFSYPWDYDVLSPVYQLEASSPVSGKNPIILTIKYQAADNNYKQAMYYDRQAGTWTPLPTKDDPAKRQATVTVPFSFVRLALFSRSDILSVGKASWYNYKAGLYAASPDFSIGSKLRVYNLANGKYVDVTVKDYGPDRTKHPDRVVDLDKEAFKKIAKTSDGVINIRIEAIKAVGVSLDKPVKPLAAPAIGAASAVVIRESDGRVLYQKNATSTSPLASLTKLVAMEVFLETKPDLKKVVTYKKQDEEYNYEYCKESESARLKVNDGETLTENDLLYSALVGSANNAIESLVRVSGLSRADFIARMNSKVESWGAASTHFIEPTGLSPDNVSSPKDYAIIAREVYKNATIQKVSTTLSYSFTTVNTKQKHTIKNTDSLLGDTTLHIVGSKTGYLDEAGYCLMTRIKNASGNLIVVTFKSKTRSGSFDDNKKLIQYGTKLLKS